jgi:Predicted transcriptional regulators
MDLLDLGPAIRDARKDKGMTQVRLAELAGTVRSRIDALENGRQADMGVRTLLKVLNAVGLDLRLTTLNNRRPTLEDIEAENEQEAGNAPGLGGR